jgi:hypothetical protein
MSSFIAMPSSSVKITKPKAFVETEEQPVSSIPVVYLASAALEPPLPSATIGCCQDFHRGVLLTQGRLS